MTTPAAPSPEELEAAHCWEAEDRVAQIEARYHDGDVPLPPHWGGFRVDADSIEFWQGRAHRLHDRFRYSLEPSGSWRIERLAP